jgi:L-aminopeptidase/D-esterase-like protein
MLDRYHSTYHGGQPRWIMPVVAETFDGILNDINTLALGEADVLAALDTASDGPVAEGNTGGGTAMIAYGFKGGTGSASRQLVIGGRSYMVGVLVQANHGQRDWLTICGVPVGRHLAEEARGGETAERGSIIVIVATDIPMAPHQLKRMARRCSLGIGRNGTPGGNSSGDIFLAFSTANARPLGNPPDIHRVEMLDDDLFDPVYMAVVDGTEEAVINAMLAAEDMVGTIDGRERVEAVPTDRILDIMNRYGRLSAPAAEIG